MNTLVTNTVFRFQEYIEKTITIDLDAGVQYQDCYFEKCHFKVIGTTRPTAIVFDHCLFRMCTFDETENKTGSYLFAQAGGFNVERISEIQLKNSEVGA